MHLHAKSQALFFAFLCRALRFGFSGALLLGVVTKRRFDTLGGSSSDQRQPSGDPNILRWISSQ